MIVAMTGGAMIATFVHAQRGDVDKPGQYVDSPSSDPEETPAPKAKHKKSPTPTPTPKKKKHAKPSATPSETPEATPRKSKAKKKHPASEESPEPSKKSKSGKKKSESEETPKAKKKKPGSPTPGNPPRKSERPSETPPVRQPLATPRSAATPNPSPPPAPVSTYQEPEQLTIQKNGYEQPRGFWARLFGGGDRRASASGYRYLSASVRAQIDHAPVQRARWQYIVVHNSGTRQGNAAVFDYYHRHVRRMQNGLAYHFVIGNGTSTGNGQIEVGDRWRRQINGGHVHSDYLNNIALGICLVGDFNRDQPTRAQLDSCEELIRYLRQRCGKVGDHYPIVEPHRQINPPRWPTDCPGNVFPYSWFRRFAE